MQNQGYTHADTPTTHTHTHTHTYANTHTHTHTHIHIIIIRRIKPHLKFVAEIIVFLNPCESN